MKPEKSTLAPPLRLDLVNQCLWRGTQMVTLTPKAFTVLRYLMDRPGQLVTKEELLNAAWPEVYVSDAALKVCIRRLRQSLGDASQVPRFIETIPWRGYRFIGHISQAPAPRGQAGERSARQSKNRLRPQSQGQSAAVKKPRAKTVNQRPGAQFSSPGTKGSHAGKETDDQRPEASSSPSQAFNFRSQVPPSPLVGRESVLAQLHSLLSSLLQGERHTIFITGEPGLGKTAIVEAFLAGLNHDPRITVAYGQCVEHYGTGEPYLPILEALEHLCRLAGHEHLVALLNRYAPMWLMQMPALISISERKRLHRELQGTTHDRMLREIAEVFTLMTADKPLVLVIEDLHWSDAATLNLLSFLTRGQHSPRLLLIGTYRADNVTHSDHELLRLVRELSAHGLGEVIPLDFLDEAAILAYLETRFPGSPFLAQLAQALHQRTEGNPLFMVNVVEHLLARRFLCYTDGRWQLCGTLADIQTHIPGSVQAMIDMQAERLTSEEQQILEAASIAGRQFSAAAVAAAMSIPIPTVEEHCTKLARQLHFLQSSDASEWPNGIVSQQYAFIHSLYQSIFYQRIPAGKRAQLHYRIGLQEEQAYTGQTEQIAGELAVHFERGHDFRRAVQYHHRAAETALERYAYREAIAHLTVGLDLLKGIPDSAQQEQQEIVLCSTLGAALTATEGYASIAVERIYSRAYTLWQHAGEISQPFPILLGLWNFSAARADLVTALTQAQQLLALADTAQDSLLLSRAHNALGATLFWQGNLLAAQQHYEHSSTVYDPRCSTSANFVHDPGVLALSSLSVIFAHRGKASQARTRAQEALTLAQQHEHPYSLALARCHVAAMHQVNQDFAAAEEMATAGMRLSDKSGFPYCLACSTIQHGWARAMQSKGRDGIEQIRQGISAYQATGAVLWRAYFLALLAEAQFVAGHTSECFQTITEGLTLAQAHGQLLPLADLYRLKGILTLQEVKQMANHKSQSGAQDCERATGFSSPPATSLTPLPPNEREQEAEGYLLRAVDIAHAQHAKSLELRATISLSRLWYHQGKREIARHTLAPFFADVNTDRKMVAWHEAQELLAALSSSSA
ncbi:MAG: AAA family ATPase [Candidatus Binatia bacterium]